MNFEGSSRVLLNHYFYDNSHAGVMYIDQSSTITFNGNSTVNLADNRIENGGGVMYIDHSSTIIFEGNSSVDFVKNLAYKDGGVIYIAHMVG